MHLDNKIVSFCGYLSLLSTFSYAFPPRAESATFLFATMDGMEMLDGMQMLDGMEICNLCHKKPQCQYQQSKRIIVLNWQSLSQKTTMSIPTIQTHHCIELAIFVCKNHKVNTNNPNALH